MATYDYVGSAVINHTGGITVLRTPVISLVGAALGDIYKLFSLPARTISLACYTKTVTTGVGSATLDFGDYLTSTMAVGDVDCLAAAVPLDATALVKGAGDQVVIEISSTTLAAATVCATVKAMASTPAAGSFQFTLVCFVA